MRTLAHVCVVTGIIVAAQCMASPVQGADSPVTGTWKLTLPTQYDTTIAILDIESGPDGLTGKIVRAHQLFEAATIEKVHLSDGTLSLDFSNKGTKDQFVGSVPKDAAEEPIKGTFRLNERFSAAELIRTDEREITTTPPDEVTGMKIARAVRKTLGTDDEIKELRQLLDAYAGDPALQSVYFVLLRPREAENLTPDEARDILNRWFADAKAYGPNWLATTEATALRALSRNPKLKDLRYEVAKKAVEDMPPQVDTELRASILRSLLTAATAEGKTDEVSAATEELARLDQILDDQYLENVPPFAVKVFGGRSDPAKNNVAIFELFTGAECPPCVAVDVAFDALLEAYKPTEMIGLQYHLHVPGPDPLANLDTLARGQYYDVHGTPSTFINGGIGNVGGGGMANAEALYNNYLGTIDGLIGSKSGASIDLLVKREGDTVTIEATAAVEPTTAAELDAYIKAVDLVKGDKEETSAEEDAQKKDETGEKKPETKEPQYRLRLVLVEERVRYAGGNRLRFHHNVVRSMPGGAEGKELVDDKGTVQTTIDLAALRTTIEDYLKEFSASREFPAPLPPIDNKHLSVVAFVQNDADKNILGAVQVPVPEAQ